MNNENLFKELINEADNEWASIVDDGIAVGDVPYYIDTGSYTLNALLSGSIYQGIPGNKTIAFAGEPSTGKTFYALNVVRKFLKDNPKSFVFLFESEGAISRDMLLNRDIDVKRVAIIPVVTVQEFRSQAVRMLNKYMETEGEKPSMLFVLDSLGNLSTTKEIEDIEKGNETRDMTRAQLIRGAFRVLRLKLAKANVPLIVTNHVYNVIGSYVPMQKMGGGSGLEYAADIIAFLSKKKDRDDDKNVTGVIITGTLRKSRLSVENKKVETLLDYQTGLDRYYGLIDLAIKFGIFKKVSTKLELPDGTSVFEKKILENPEKYFTKEILDKIDEMCKDEFLYGITSLADAEKVK